MQVSGNGHDMTGLDYYVPPVEGQLHIVTSHAPLFKACEYCYCYVMSAKLHIVQWENLAGKRILS